MSREAVVAEAKSWMGTPWHHQARVKGAGVDCANFVIAAYANSGTMPDITLKQLGNYPRDWHIHKTEERFLTFVPNFAVEITESELKPGDLILFRIRSGRVFSHAAIVVDYPQGIHASLADGSVVLCDFDRDHNLTECDRKFFTHKDWL
jgi:NlpC/P60 family putative phage cell wall peptidase